MSATYGMPDHPRTLIDLRDAAIAEQVARLVGDAHFVKEEQRRAPDLGQGRRGDGSAPSVVSHNVFTGTSLPLELRFRSEDWDLLVTDSAVVDAASSWYVVAFGASHLGQSSENDECKIIEMQSAGVAIPHSAGDIVSLVKDDLVPRAAPSPSHGCLAVKPWTGETTTKLAAMRGVTPFLVTRHGEVIAGSFSRPNDATAQVWFLPPYADKLRWVELALAEWSAIDETRFPSKPTWRNDQRWMPTAEDAAAQTLADIRDERESILADLAARESAAIERLRSETVGADNGTRRLLVDKGDDLVGAVADALTTLGFDVVVVDDLSEKGQKLEDLQVRAPADDPEWVALVEVRGYNGGAAVNDLPRLERFAARHQKANGRWASAHWYIVNQFAGKDPSTRPRMLDSNPTERDDFVDEYNGGLIDTAVLFQWLKVVNADTLSAAEARRALIGLRGVLEMPPSPAEG